MALAKIVKINLIAHKKFQDKIWKVLQDSGSVEVIGVDGTRETAAELNEKISKLDYRLAGVKFSLSFLQDFDKSKKTLVEKLNPQIVLSEDKLVEVAENFETDKIVGEVQEVESGIIDTQNRVDKNQADIELLTPWKKLSFVPDLSRLPSGYAIKFVGMSAPLYKNIEKEFSKKLPLSDIEIVEDTGKEIFLSILHKTEQEPVLQELLNRVKAKTFEFPELKDSVVDTIEKFVKETEKHKKQIEKFQKQGEKLARRIRELKIVYDYLYWQKLRLQNSLKASASWQTFAMKAWIDEQAIEGLREQVEKVTKNFSIDKIEMEKDEIPPVKFKNSWARSFESVTEIYGSPQSHEPDPTPFLAPFFTIFFGLALTDAGYGLVLALGIPLAIKLLKIPKNSRKLLWVLFWGGVSSFLMGALTGGWFSIELLSLPAFIGKPLASLRVINPLENALAIFYLSLGLGVVQVLFGLGINTWWKIKSGEAKAAILGSGMWMVTIIALLVFAGSSAGLLPLFLKTPFTYIIFAAVAVLIIGKATQSKNFFLGLPTGVLGLYDIVGYFSDVLSYSRLLALGLTTGIIGMVVNLIASLVMGIPFVGWLFGLLILVGGHIFNLGINALGAFIHSGRLQYIEFFPKFMEGGGKPFAPLARESSYVRAEG